MKYKDRAQNTRRIALALWLCLRGGIHQVALDIGLNQGVKGRISKIIQKQQPIGRQTAQTLERVLGMSAHFLDAVPEGYESILDELVHSNLFSFSCLFNLTGDPKVDLDMIRLDMTFAECEQPLKPTRISPETPPVQVSTKWSYHNISNFEAIQEFCIVTNFVRQDSLPTLESS